MQPKTVEKKNHKRGHLNVSGRSSEACHPHYPPTVNSINHSFPFYLKSATWQECASIKIRGDRVKVLRGAVLGGLQRPGWDGGAERPLQSLPTPGPASECPLRGSNGWEAQPQSVLSGEVTPGKPSLRQHSEHRRWERTELT